MRRGYNEAGMETMILDVYTQYGGQHPHTAALKNILAYYGVKAPHTGEPFTEAMLLGIGGLGAGYILWEFGEPAIKAMKLGAVDFIIKSKENFKHLPEKIISYIHDYESEIEKSDVYKLKRKTLMRDPDVKEFIKAFVETKLTEILPYSETMYYYEPNFGGSTGQKMEQILQALALNKVLNKKPMAVKVACPRCDSDNIETRPVCPNCGGKVFVKNTDADGDPFRCLSGCGEAFTEVKPFYRCNSCTKEFPQEESKYRHVYSFTVNTPMMLELKQELSNTEELKIWEAKSKQYNKNIEETKKMQNEIRDQLKALIEQQVKGS